MKYEIGSKVGDGDRIGIVIRGRTGPWMNRVRWSDGSVEDMHTDDLHSED